MHAIETICCPIIKPLNWVLPIKRLPEVAIILIFFVIFFMTEFIVLVMEAFSAYTGISSFMVGLTLMVWGSDNMEMLNLGVSIAKG